MASFKKKYDATKLKNAIGMMTELIRRLRAGELEIDTFGIWPGVAGSWTFRISFKESEKSKIF